MTNWLLAAEADKIQDLVFRSSKLVQVVGGSSLLTRFCREVPHLILEHHLQRVPTEDEIIIADGGSFRLVLDDEEKSVRAGLDLAESYYRATGGSLTVADPRPFDDAGFETANRAAEADLRTKKQDRRAAASAEAAAHMPYVALCASCGVLLATNHAARHSGEVANYICDVCQVKAAERDLLQSQPRQERFLTLFFDTLKRFDSQDDLPWERVPGLFPEDANAVGSCDVRGTGHVAYLVADGNSMGVLFSRCRSPRAMRELSTALTAAMWQALAKASMRTCKQLWASGKANGVPVLPLIVGGDDLFALLPVPYSLDFARQACLAFEEAMRPHVQNHGLVKDSRELPALAAAVVICKANYPYALAHRLGESLLGRAKRLSRAANLRHGVNLSCVDLALVRGSDVQELDQLGALGRTHVVPSAAPYWASPGDLPSKAIEYALDLQELLDVRRDLNALPGKRRAELRRLFWDRLPDEGAVGGRETALADLRDRWELELEALLQRIEPDPAGRPTLRGKLDLLGDPGGTHARWRRFGARPDQPVCHGLPDLLEAWDFGQDLNHGLGDYEEEGR